MSEVGQGIVVNGILCDAFSVVLNPSALTRICCPRPKIADRSMEYMIRIPALLNVVCREWFGEALFIRLNYFGNLILFATAFLLFAWA